MKWKADLRLWILLFAILLLASCFNCYAEEMDIQKIIQIESGGNPHAYNKRSGAIGLMQITPICLEEFNKAPYPDCKFEPEWQDDNGVWWSAMVYCPEPREFPYTFNDLYDSVKNVRVGTWYIQKRIPQMLKAYGIEDTVENRLIAYNFGIGNLRKYLRGEKKLPKETRDYIRKYKEGR